ncbi:hypothetical protein EKH57_07130 [Halorubrum sp. BOL3-1]|uniref:restriction endonuclease subunit S n=1 Tax=Halorubrum sp. BOL3-1 TaxID=2497325 RepID=UPI001004E6DD|nr:restriction endonuclease subunit S [Halorubrum sp. BOL3-1]QAU12512.1 hypothetical protein EKH57_07130 [Halorubrum sp. BOL3-1]
MSEDTTLNEFVENEKHESSNLELGPIEVEIPDEWDSRQLSTVFDLITGNSYTGDYLSDEDNSGRIFLTLKSVNKGGGFNWDSLKYYTGEVNEREVVEPGELLIANTDVTQDGDIVGYSIRVPDFDSEKEIAASMDLSILRPTLDNINLPYIEYLLQTDFIHSRMRAFSAGSTVLHLNTDLVKSLSLPLPPLSEQRKIATVLYTVNQAIEKTEKIREQIERVRAGTAQDLFRNGISQGETKETWLGEIPEDWDVVPFSKIVDSNRNGLYKSKDAYGEGCPIAKMGNALEKRTLDMSSADRLELTDEEKQKYGLNEGDLIFARRAQEVSAAGDCCYVPQLDELTVFESSLIRVRLAEGANPRFYTQYFDSPVGSRSIERIVTETSISGIATSDLLDLKVAVPSLAEQEEIASIMWKFDEQEKSLQKEREWYERLKRGLIQDLLSGTVRMTDTNIEVPEEVTQHG